jgi:hypothetical protein
MHNMKDHFPIEVIIPQPWRTIGRLFVFVAFLTVIGYFWRLFIYPEPPDDEMAGVAYFSFFVTPFLFAYTMPLFLNRYPSWFVRLVGREYVNRLIADSKRHLGQNRKIKAQLLRPKNWFNDKIFFWLAMIIGAGLLGILRGAGLL